MTTDRIIEGLTILQKYRKIKDNYEVSAEHDILYGGTTDIPVAGTDLERIIEIGWFQEGLAGGDDFTVEHYTPCEPWACFT